MASVKAKHARVVRPIRWRKFADLSPAEKAAVRRMYAAGKGLALIAQRFRVYAGTISTAAERGRWPGGADTVARRIVKVLAAHPASKDAVIAELVGCDVSYVTTVRWHLEATSAKGAR